MKLPVNLQPTPRKPNKIEHGKEPKMSEQWEEIKIEDVQPGDVARCNGREFPVVHWFGEAPWVVKVGRFTAGPEWGFFKFLGFTFHRKVKREPRTFDTNIEVIDGYHYAQVPTAWTNGTRVRVTELLDGEDGA